MFEKDQIICYKNTIYRKKYSNMCSSRTVGMSGSGSILSKQFIRFCGLFILSFYFSKAQNVTFRLSDENTYRFIFYGETDIDIVCEVSAISDLEGLSFEVRRNSDIIYDGQNVPSEFTDRYAVSNGNLSRTITVKQATPDTAGVYLCVVSFGSEFISRTFYLNLTMSVHPQCWANKPNELTEGESIRLQCYYGDASNQLESYWENINQSLQKETLDSSEVFLGVKKIRTADVESISLHNNGSRYLCGVTHKQFNVFPIFTCEIGPISVTKIIEMIFSSTEKPTKVQTDNNVSSDATSHPPTISAEAETTLRTEPYTTAKQQVTMFSSVPPSEPIVVPTNPLDFTIPKSTKRTVSDSPIDYLTRNTFTLLTTSTVSLPDANFEVTTKPPIPTTLTSTSQAVSSTQSTHVTYNRLTLSRTSSHAGALTTTSSTSNDAQFTATRGVPPYITTKHSSQDSTTISAETSRYVSGTKNVPIHVMTSGDDLDDLVTTLLTSEREGMPSTYLPPEVESPQSQLLELLLFYVIPLFVVIVLIILILPLICICSRRRHDSASNDFSLGYAGSSRNSHYYDSSVTPSNHNGTAVQANVNAVELNSAGNHGDDESSIEKVYTDPANTWIASTHL